MKKCQGKVCICKLFFLGIYYYNCGDRYEGQWSKNKKNGHGNTH